MKLVILLQVSLINKMLVRQKKKEIGMISALQHPNLVKLYGCCVERNELMLVYEYLENNSLFRALFGNFAASCFAIFPSNNAI